MFCGIFHSLSLSRFLYAFLRHRTVSWFFRRWAPLLMIIIVDMYVVVVVFTAVVMYHFQVFFSKVFVAKFNGVT